MLRFISEYTYWISFLPRASAGELSGPGSCRCHALRNRSGGVGVWDLGLGFRVLRLKGSRV